MWSMRDGIQKKEMPLAIRGAVPPPIKISNRKKSILLTSTSSSPILDLYSLAKAAISHFTHRGADSESLLERRNISAWMRNQKDSRKVRTITLGRKKSLEIVPKNTESNLLNNKDLKEKRPHMSTRLVRGRKGKVGVVRTISLRQEIKPKELRGCIQGQPGKGAFSKPTGR